MRSIALAITWEYWRRNVWLTLGFIAGGTAIMIISFGPQLNELNRLDSSGRHFLHFIPFLFAMIGQAVVTLKTIHKNCFEFPKELYIRPVSTSTLVALRMALGISMAVVMYLGQALLIWAATSAILPLWWGNLLALAMATAWTHVIIWSLPGLALLQVIGLYLVTILSLSYYGYLFSVPGFIGTSNPGRVVIDLYAIGMVASLTGLAYVVALVGVRFDRRGDRISLARVFAWISDRIYTIRQTDRPFRSACAAQFWFEWRQHWGWLLPLLNALSLAVYVTLAVSRKDVTLVDGLTFLWGLGFVNVLAYPVLIAIVVNTQERVVSKDLFGFTRPVSDNTLLRVRLRVAIMGLLASWGVWLAGAIVISGLLWATDKQEGLIHDLNNFIGGPEYLRHPDRLFSFLARIAGLIVLNIWAVLGIVGSLHMTGRKAVAVLWMVPLLIYTLWIILVTHDLIADSIVTLVQAATPWAIGILSLAGTALIYGVAVYKGRITRWLPFAAFGAYLLLCQLIYPWPDRWSDAFAEGNPGAIVYILGLLTLPLLPLALGPLAIAWNRHR